MSAPRMRSAMITLLLFMIATIGRAQFPCSVQSSAGRDGEEDLFNQYVIDFEQQGLHLNTDVNCLPVVFHIINWPAFPIALATDQLERTNQHFRRTHVDTINTRDLFVPFATDSHIELRLASIDPQGSSFSGIHHINVPGYDLSMTTSVIEANMFDHTRYVNVWMFPGISASGVFPWEATATHDGIIVAPENVGYQLGGNDPDVQGGKVFTHEIGHYLGLYHPFHGDAWTDPGNCTEIDCQTEGDRCCDTPIDYRMFPLPGDECTMDTLWCVQGENVLPNDENFMFYNLDRCQNMFTIDQRVRMRACLSDLRASLTAPENQTATGITCESTVSIPALSDRTMAMYTDPTGSDLYLNVISKKGSMELMIFDQAGRIVKESALRSQDQIIDLRDLKPGMYQVILNFDQEVIHRKIVKQ